MSKSPKKKSSNAKNKNTNEISDNQNIEISTQKKQNVQSENSKKIEIEIQKQNNINKQIEEIKDQIKFEKEQHEKLMTAKKNELQKKENAIIEIKNTNKQLENEILKIENDFEEKLNLENTENLEKIKENEPLKIELKEKDEEVNNSWKIIDQYKKEISNLRKNIKSQIDFNQISLLKEQINDIKIRINGLETEKSSLMKIKNDHIKCIEKHNNLKKNLEEITDELNNLRNENKKQGKINSKNKNAFLRNNRYCYKGLTEKQIKLKKERHIQNSLDEFWNLNKSKLIKYGQTDRNDSITINQSESKKTNFEKKLNFAENLKNTNLDISSGLPIIAPLFSTKEKNILSSVLPENEINILEKRYKSIDTEKKNMQRQYNFQVKQLIKENKNIIKKYEYNNNRIKENENKNNLLMSQIDSEINEHKNLRSKLINIEKEIDNKKKLIDELNEENKIMAEKLQQIKMKYMDDEDYEEQNKNVEDEEENNEDDSYEEENENED